MDVGGIDGKEVISNEDVNKIDANVRREIGRESQGKHNHEFGSEAM